MSKHSSLNIARLVYDAYPHSDLLPIDPEADCRDLPTLMRRVTNDDIGDSLFRFLVIEIVEGGESTLNGAIRVVHQARNDINAVLQALTLHSGQTSRQKEELRHLDNQAKTLRQKLGYSQPGEVIWQARLDFNELLVVVADGYGCASVLHVSGNYPTEYILKNRKDFDNEQAACTYATKLAAKIQT